MNTDKSLEWMLLESSKGNTSAFRLLYEVVKDDAFRFTRYRVGSRDDALDILQETFIDLWEALKKKRFAYVSDPEFRGFLYTILKRRIARYYRFRKTALSLDDLEIDPEEADHSEASHILRSLERLNPEDQEVMRLRYFEGQSFGEIASLLNKEENAIKVRHHRALEKLRQILDYDPFDKSQGHGE